MFDFLKKDKQFELSSPVSGKLIKLSEVNDQVFSSKMMGDGLAIKPDDTKNSVVVSSPVDGKIVSLPNTKHAFGIETKDHVDVLVHIGLDTVNLKGKGFTSYLKQGDKVKRGAKVISFDPDIIRLNKLDDTVMVILTDGYNKTIAPKVEYNKKTTSNEILLE